MSTFHKIKKFAIRVGDNDVDEMLNRQNMTGMKQGYIKIDNGIIGTLGSVELNRNHGNCTLIAGEPTNTSGLSKIQDYRDAVRIFPSLDGAFIAIHYDRFNKKLVVASDFLGFQPCYFRQKDGNFFLASETKAFGSERDLSAWGAFFSWGHLIGSRTLVKDVKKLESASILVYDIENKIVNKEKYWNFPSPRSRYNIDDIIESLNESIQRYSDGTENSRLLLSGGLDSRLILYSLVSLGVQPEAIIVSHDDEYEDLDGRFAELCANRVNINYKKFNIVPDFFSSFHYLDYLRLSDAATPSLFLFISKIAQILAELPPGAVFDGLMPDKLLKPPPYAGGGGLKDFVSQNSNAFDSRTWRMIRTVFNPRVAERMYEGYYSDLKAELGKYPDDFYGVLQFNLLNRGSRRIAINPVQVYANYAVPLLPGMTRDFLNTTASIPFGEKENNKLYLKLFMKVCPDACRIPFLSGGTLVSNKKNLTYWSSLLRMTLLDFIKTYPNFTRPMGLLKSKAKSQSDFFFLSKHIEGDTDITIDNLKKIHPTDPLFTSAWKTVFHWHAWHLVHNGRLSELLP
jgi:asparagine synthase (glutamine-hydrolysing)